MSKATDVTSIREAPAIRWRMRFVFLLLALLGCSGTPKGRPPCRIPPLRMWRSSRRLRAPHHPAVPQSRGGPAWRCGRAVTACGYESLPLRKHRCDHRTAVREWRADVRRARGRARGCVLRAGSAPRPRAEPETVTDPCAISFLQTFGRRAYRRPPTGTEEARWLSIAAASDDPWTGLRSAVSGMLQSPWVVYRTELGSPDPERPAVHRLDDHELAARLAFVLWNRGPDDALLDAVDAGRLEPGGLEAEVDRMLDDRPAVDGGLLRSTSTSRGSIEPRRIGDLPDLDAYAEGRDAVERPSRRRTGVPEGCGCRRLFSQRRHS